PSWMTAASGFAETSSFGRSRTAIDQYLPPAHGSHKPGSRVGQWRRLCFSLSAQQKSLRRRILGTAFGKDCSLGLERMASGSSYFCNKRKKENRRHAKGKPMG